MIFGLEYLDIITIAFFIISTYILVLNLYTISRLRDEKKEISENQQLLATLLGQMQGYFSKIDHGIDRIGTEEGKLYEVLDSHQKEENKVLDAIEANQALFLSRMERIVDIQQNLLERINLIPVGNIIQDKVLPQLERLARSQSSETSIASNNMENALHELQEHVIALESKLGPELSSVSNELKRGINQNILGINETFKTLNDTLIHRINTLHESDAVAEKSKESVIALSSYIEIAQANIKKVIDQSIDLNPIYKSIHGLIDQLELMQKEYSISKEDISILIEKLQRHEQNDLNALRNDVEGFLVDLKIEINDSVEILKKEFHLAQSQVSDTVKTLSERSQIKKAYGFDG